MKPKKWKSQGQKWWPVLLSLTAISAAYVLASSFDPAREIASVAAIEIDQGQSSSSKASSVEKIVLNSGKNLEDIKVIKIKDKEFQLDQLEFSAIDQLVHSYTVEAEKVQEEFYKDVQRLENEDISTFDLELALDVQNRINEKKEILTTIHLEKEAIKKRIEELYQEKNQVAPERLLSINENYDRELEKAAEIILKYDGLVTEQIAKLQNQAEEVETVVNQETEESSEEVEEIASTESTEEAQIESTSDSNTENSNTSFVICERTSNNNSSDLLAGIEKLIEQQSESIKLMQQMNQMFMTMNQQMLESHGEMMSTIREYGLPNYNRVPYQWELPMEYQSPGRYYNPMYNAQEQAPSYGDNNHVYHGDVYYSSPYRAPGMHYPANNMGQHLGKQSYVNFGQHNGQAGVNYSANNSFYQGPRYNNQDFSEVQ